MKNSKTINLGEVIKLITKGTTPNKKMGGFCLAGINYIKSESIKYDGKIDKDKFSFISKCTHEVLKRSQLKENDILFSMAGAYLGKSAIVTKDLLPANTNQALAIIRIDELKANPKFINYFFKDKNVIDYVNNISGQSAQPNINFEEIKSINIPFFSLRDQEKIVSLLSSLDDKIDLLHRQNKTLESMAETLFRQWFIEQAQEDWPSSSFSIWINDTKSGDWGKEFPVEDFIYPVQCVRGTDISDLQNGLPTRTPLRFIKNKKLMNISPENGDIIIEISGGTETQSTGRCYFINDDVKRLFKQPVVFSNFCRLLKLKKKEYSYFVYLYLSRLYKNDEMFAFENGSSGIKNLDYKTLLFTETYRMPPFTLVEKFDEVVKVFFSKIISNKRKIQTLESLRDTLLPKLMSGEVRVEYAEEAIASVA